MLCLYINEMSASIAELLMNMDEFVISLEFLQPRKKEIIRPEDDSGGELDALIYIHVKLHPNLG